MSTSTSSGLLLLWTFRRTFAKNLLSLGLMRMSSDGGCPLLFLFGSDVAHESCCFSWLRLWYSESLSSIFNLRCWIFFCLQRCWVRVVTTLVHLPLPPFIDSVFLLWGAEGIALGATRGCAGDVVSFQLLFGNLGGVSLICNKVQEFLHLRFSSNLTFRREVHLLRWASAWLGSSPLFFPDNGGLRSYLSPLPFFRLRTRWCLSFWGPEPLYSTM